MWKRFSNLYGYTFTRQYGDEPTDEWMMVLDQVTAEQIAKGLNSCFDNHKEFPPNPMQFLALCMPSGEDYGLPSDKEAFQQATGVSTTKHPAVALTLRNMGDAVFEMRRAVTKDAESMFQLGWVNTVVFVAGGGELPDVAMEIEEKKERMDKAEALGLFATMRGNLDLEPAEPKRIDTTSVEEELKEMKIIKRGGE